MLEMLQRTPAAGPEMPAARCDALGRRAQHVDHFTFVVAALASRAAKPHLLAGQRAVDEDRLAANMRDAASLLVQGFDLGRFGRGGLLQAWAQAAAY